MTRPSKTSRWRPTTAERAMQATKDRPEKLQKAGTGLRTPQSSDSKRLELPRLQPQRGPKRHRTFLRLFVPRRIRSWQPQLRQTTALDSLLILRYQKCQAILPNTSPQSACKASSNLTGRIKRLPAVTRTRRVPRPLRLNSNPFTTIRRPSRWGRPALSTSKHRALLPRHFSIHNQPSQEQRLLLRRWLALKSNP